MATGFFRILQIETAHKCKFIRDTSIKHADGLELLVISAPNL